MNVLRWMIAGSGLSLAAAMVLFADARAEIVLGMIGPLAVAGGSWVLAERTWHRAPERLTAVMIAAFGGKLVFFAAYVALMLNVLSLRPVPFVASFTGYFIALHLTEAMALRRLFATPMRAAGQLLQ